VVEKGSSLDTTWETECTGQSENERHLVGHLLYYQCAASTLTERDSEIEALLKGMEATAHAKSGLAAPRHTEKDMSVPTVSTEALRARVEAVAYRPHFKRHEKTL
jgi:hypothetical protein